MFLKLTVYAKEKKPTPVLSPNLILLFVFATHASYNFSYSEKSQSLEQPPRDAEEPPC